MECERLRMTRVTRSISIAALTIGLSSCAALGLRSVGGPDVSHANARADIQAALVEARADQKLVLLDFGANWCGPCHELRSRFHAPHAASYLQAKFHIVYVDIGRFDRNDDVVPKYGFVTSEGIPALAVLASRDRKSTRLNSSHGYISYAVFCLKKKRQQSRAD